MNNGYMCWVKGGGRPKKIHETLEIAQNEAARLANINPTQNVYVVEIVSVIEATVIKEPVVKPEVAPNRMEEVMLKTLALAQSELSNYKTTPVKVKTSNTLSLPKKGK